MRTIDKEQSQKTSKIRKTVCIPLERLVSNIENGYYPIEQMRLWVLKKYPDPTNSNPEYEEPRRLISALLRWYEETIDSC